MFQKNILQIFIIVSKQYLSLCQAEQVPPITIATEKQNGLRDHSQRYVSLMFLFL